MSSKINPILLKHRVGLSHKDTRILEWLSIVPYFGTVVYDKKFYSLLPGTRLHTLEQQCYTNAPNRVF